MSRATEQLQREKARKDEHIQSLTNTLNTIARWADAELHKHQPYTHDIDLTCHGPDLKQALLKRMGEGRVGELWCATCRNPWPCQRIPGLRAVKRAAGRGDQEALDLLDALTATAEATPPVEGQIKVRM